MVKFFVCHSWSFSSLKRMKDFLLFLLGFCPSKKKGVEFSMKLAFVDLPALDRGVKILFERADAALGLAIPLAAALVLTGALLRGLVIGHWAPPDLVDAGT
jgi:hypothetical protein